MLILWIIAGSLSSLQVPWLLVSLLAHCWLTECLVSFPDDFNSLACETTECLPHCWLSNSLLVPWILGSLTHCQLMECLALCCLSDPLLPPWTLLDHCWLSELLCRLPGSLVASSLIAGSLDPCWLPDSLSTHGMPGSLLPVWLITASLVPYWIIAGSCSSFAGSLAPFGLLAHCWLTERLPCCWLSDSLSTHGVPGSLLPV